MESFEELSEQYTPMIHKIMNTLHIFKNKEEFYQLGLIALWEANERFDPQKGSFTTFAYSYIKG
ncbi:MAG: sigma factor, partial [Bacillota bacterium]|nr:sigma factor [Bacillota bacterium]